MKRVALALSFVAAGYAAASDPENERHFETTESTLERTCSAMKRLKPGMSKAEVERLLPLRAIEAGPQGGKRQILSNSTIYFIDRKHMLMLFFRTKSEGQLELKYATLHKSDPEQIMARVGDWD